MNFLSDLWGFLKHRKKFWLLPLIIDSSGLRRAHRAGQRIRDRAVYLHVVLVTQRDSEVDQ